MATDTGFLRATYNLLGSIRFTVFLLLTLAAGALLGTLLPQGMSQPEILMRYGPQRAHWIQLLRLDDLYHALWFQALLLLLGTNLTVCTLNRLPKTLKILSRKENEINPERLLKFGQHATFATPLALDQARSAMEPELVERFGRLRVLSTSPSFTAVAEKGRWSHWMLYLVHGSVLLILFGALLGSVLGFKGFMNIPEGESTAQVHLFGREQTVVLPFEVRCDRFEVAYYDNGMPKDYRSDLTIRSQGEDVEKRSIRVNDPLTHAGVTFYQSSYGSDLQEVELSLTKADTQENFRVSLPFRRPVALPGTAGDLQVVEFREDFQGFGPALAIGLYRDDQEPTGSWILADRPDFHGNRVGDYQVQVLRLDKRSYTGLQVKKDPGVWLVLTGFVTLLIGMGLSFYTSHCKLWLVAEAGNPTSRIVVAGRSNKNSLAFESEFNHLCERLRLRLQAR
ncbi:MAG: hypothetical protein COT06_09945 [Syntrophobacteraceae bacterium CG07_land_8_20_14_0_80_61_8]|nr:MAG: hypothetical protein COT06_09945 [Syntrophobacteraceae bacterium CG07_land_8_20_14_0_80_61_8]